MVAGWAGDAGRLALYVMEGLECMVLMYGVVGNGMVKSLWVRIKE